MRNEPSANSNTAFAAQDSTVLQTTTSGHPLVVVVVPTYNESGNLPVLFDRLFAQQIPNLHVLIVDDASPDGTGALVDAMAQTNPAVHILHRTGRGRGHAVVAGFRWALAHGAERIVEMDADLSHAPEDVPRLLQATETIDVASGSRGVGGAIRNRGVLRNALTAIINRLNRVMLGLPFEDISGSFKCFRRAALEKIDITRLVSQNYTLGAELLFRSYRTGCTIREVPIIFHDRVAGVSKCSLRVMVNYLLTLIKLRCRAILGKF